MVCPFGDMPRPQTKCRGEKSGGKKSPREEQSRSQIGSARNGQAEAKAGQANQSKTGTRVAAAEAGQAECDT